MPEANITPTIGRKVWFWMSEDSAQEAGSVIHDEKQAFDATVTFVYPDGKVNLFVIDHDCEAGAIIEVPFRDYVEGETEHGGDEDFCTWMPYQKSQAQKAFDEARKEEAGDARTNSNKSTYVDRRNIVDEG